MGSILPTSPGISKQQAPVKALASSAPKKSSVATKQGLTTNALSFQAQKAAVSAKAVSGKAVLGKAVLADAVSAKAATQLLAARANSASAANMANAAKNASQNPALPMDRRISVASAVTVSQPTANQPAASQPAASQPAARQPTVTRATPNQAGSPAGGSAGQALATSAKPQTSKAYGTVAPNFSVMQQNWLDANAGPMANLMVNSLNRTEPYKLDPLPLQWANLSGGGTYGSYRAVGIVTKETAKELASLMGGQVADSPFGTFGTETRDTYIKMPNGQMIDASVLAANLNAAREGRDPFNSLQAMLDVYQGEARQFNWNRSTDAIDNVNGGRFGRAPQGLPT